MDRARFSTLLKWSTLSFLICGFAFSVNAKSVFAHDIPVPETVSPQFQRLIAAPAQDWWKFHPQDVKEWKDFVSASAAETAKDLPVLREKFGVVVKTDKMGGVKIFMLAPKEIKKENEDRILLHLHGGGYVFNPGETGTTEAIYMAGIGKTTVISVDYRMAPDFPYPAALDDALTVYRELLKKYPSQKIGVFGTSAGGGMTLALVLRARMEGLPLPGAIAPCTPWSDLSKTGDSYFINDGIDNFLVRYDGLVKDMAELYANGQNLRDPLVSPVYGDVSGFPPTLLTTGTRDLFLSNTARMHLKLREAGVPADLIVFEGMSHAPYLIPHASPDTPEFLFLFTELAKFFDKNLKHGN